MIGSKKTSPNSIASTDIIFSREGQTSRLQKGIKDANHEITSRYPTMEGASLGRELNYLEDPENFVEKTKLKRKLKVKSNNQQPRKH